MLNNHFPLIIEQLNRQRVQIEDWLQAQWRKVPIPFYASVDLRESDFKLAPVDVNLYPGGFNNLSSQDLAQATQLIKPLLDQTIHTGYQRLLIIAEAHTRN